MDTTNTNIIDIINITMAYAPVTCYTRGSTVGIAGNDIMKNQNEYSHHVIEQISRSLSESEGSTHRYELKRLSRTDIIRSLNLSIEELHRQASGQSLWLVINREISDGVDDHDGDNHCKIETLL